MCYSAQIWAQYRSYVREFGAVVDLHEYVEIYWARRSDAKIKIPKGVDAGFGSPATAEEQRIKDLIDEFNVAEVQATEEELFKQRKRLADAERALLAKQTKKAMDDQRIATDKIAKALAKLRDLGRTELEPPDSRIFPGYYAPVMVMESGRRVVKPMRYQCRPAGKSAFYDTKYPGTYNARKDNLQGFWKDLFGLSHGIMVVDAFYENVSTSEGNIVLEFRPNTAQPILVACLWSRWEESRHHLLSFAAITDNPPPEVAAAGHDRCIVSIKAENIDTWLQPDTSCIEEQLAILNDPIPVHYEHRLAA